MYRVLLVEDDRGIADALCAQLGDWGFAVRAVENFRDGPENSAHLIHSSCCSI